MKLGIHINKQVNLTCGRQKTKMPQFFSTTCLGRRSGFLCFFGGQARPKSILPAAADGSNAETAKELDEEKHMEEPKVDKSQPSQPSFAKLVQRFQTALKMVMLGALFLSMLCVLGAVISNVSIFYTILLCSRCSGNFF